MSLAILLIIAVKCFKAIVLPYTLITFEVLLLKAAKHFIVTQDVAARKLKLSAEAAYTSNPI
jgi:hypothetical protein